MGVAAIGMRRRRHQDCIIKIWLTEARHLCAARAQEQLHRTDIPLQDLQL
jgi:hypothetical protein